MKYSFDKESFKKNLNEFLNPIKIWDTCVKKNDPKNLAEATMDVVLAIITPLLTWMFLPITILGTILLSYKNSAGLKKIK
ncbi:MAG TPA: hypothetical protein HA283_01090 [Nanoarchaeota archaeon]|nr:hypothetical protein [Nanoarchaeota archaeon]HIH62867.1 hypothetical protein [Nanoarchaeota archaeon]HIJ10284.1 hypothetical protein [Nanoarchaeota archaeon]